MDGNSDLAVGLLAHRPAVLPLDADGVGSLLGEGNIFVVVDPFGAGKGLRMAGAVASEDGVLAPGALVDELLEGLFGVGAGQSVRQSDPAGKRLDGLAFAVEQQPLEVHAGPPSRLGLGKVIREQGGVLAEPAEDCRIESWGVGLHARVEAGTA